MTPAALSSTVKEAARDLGFDAVGISVISGDPTSPQAAAPDPRQDLRGRLTDWLRRGFHATMAWMARDPARRADPAVVLPGCRSLISVGLNYYTDH
jgi:epoxyqueuosine reductase